MVKKAYFMSYTFYHNFKKSLKLWLEGVCLSSVIWQKDDFRATRSSHPNKPTPLTLLFLPSGDGAYLSTPLNWTPFDQQNVMKVIRVSSTASRDLIASPFIFWESCPKTTLYISWSSSLYVHMMVYIHMTYVRHFSYNV